MNVSDLHLGHNILFPPYSKYPLTNTVPLIICEAVAVPSGIFNMICRYVPGSTIIGASRFTSTGAANVPMAAAIGNACIPNASLF